MQKRRVIIQKRFYEIIVFKGARNENIGLDPHDCGN